MEKKGLLFFWDLNGKKFGLVTSLFQPGDQNSNLGFCRNILWNENFSQKEYNFSIVLGMASNFFQNVSEKFRAKLSKMPSTRPEDSVEQLDFL